MTGMGEQKQSSGGKRAKVSFHWKGKVVTFFVGIGIYRTIKTYPILGYFQEVPDSVPGDTPPGGPHDPNAPKGSPGPLKAQTLMSVAADAPAESPPPKVTGNAQEFETKLRWECGYSVAPPADPKIDPDHH